MPFVKPFKAGETSDVNYKADIVPEVSNTPDNPVDAAMKTMLQSQNDHLEILNEANGIMKPTQSAGSKLNNYKVLNSKIRLNVIKACCSSKAASIAFKRFKNRGVRKRKVIIVNTKTNLKYKYSMSKDGLKREK
jgi:hypothetical protein